MLMMRRRVGETILIGADIEIHIARIGRTRVKIAIEAPRHLRVVAKEVEVVGAQNRAAAALIAKVLQNRWQGSAEATDKSSEVAPGHPQQQRTRARHEAG